MTATVRVNNLHLSHPQLRAEDWRSPLVRRLLQDKPYEDGCCEVESSFKAGEMSQQVTSNAEFVWDGLREDFTKVLKSYQEPVITEFATLGLACALVTEHIGLEITEVTRRGDRADYWLGDRDFMLEVSGQQSGSLEALCIEKAKQLQSNPFDKNGYVCVANYANAKARLWFYSAAEGGVDSVG